MATIGFGSTLNRIATPVPELKTLSHSGKTLNLVDVTHHDSANTFTEFIAGIRDGGEVTGEGNFTGVAAQTVLNSDLDAGTRSAYTLEFGAVPLKTLSFNAYVTRFEVTAPYAAELGLSFTLKVDGKPTIA